MILTTVAPSRDNILRVQEWLGVHIPEWRSMLIRDKGKYLGLLIGPGVGPVSNWAAPMNKMVERVSLLGEQGWPLDMLPG